VCCRILVRRGGSEGQGLALEAHQGQLVPLRLGGAQRQDDETLQRAAGREGGPARRPAGGRARTPRPTGAALQRGHRARGQDAVRADRGVRADRLQERDHCEAGADAQCGHGPSGEEVTRTGDYQPFPHIVWPFIAPSAGIWRSAGGTRRPPAPAFPAPSARTPLRIRGIPAGTTSSLRVHLSYLPETRWCPYQH
jgi:hypothetical protein